MFPIFGVVLSALVFILPASGQAESLFAVEWSAKDDLKALAEFRVRFIAPRILFFSAEDKTEQLLRELKLKVVFVDRPAPDENYYILDHLHPPLAGGIHLVYRAQAGWGLVRIEKSQLNAVHQEQDFLWPLPQRYSLKGWLEDEGRAKPVQTIDNEVVLALAGRVNRARLQRDVEVLSLIDPDGGSGAHNLRTRYARRTETFESTLYIRQQLAEALGAEAVRLDSFRIGPDEPLMYNVVGELKGSDPDAGYYVICGHYDAIGARTREWNWEVDPAPGADDNATGTALVLESARVLADQRLPWGIRFIAFSGEELGLWGSRHYTAGARERDEQVLGALNFDMIGFNNTLQRMELVVNPGSRWLADQMVAANERFSLGLLLDVLVDGSAGRSDHEPFWSRGYDALLGIENYLPDDPNSIGIEAGKYRLNTQYHKVSDVPDSINWHLVEQTTQLAVVTLAQYGIGTGLPNLAVASGDLRGDTLERLRIQVANVGLGPSSEPFGVRVSRCGVDSLDCEVIYERQQEVRLAPGAAWDIAIEWQRYGEMVFLVEVDRDNQVDEANEADNRTFQRVRLVPQSDIVVFPNPFRPKSGQFLAFSGVPLKARVRVFNPSGELVWTAQEDDVNQRRLGARANEILWRGVNRANAFVSTGVYVYILSAADGEVLRQAKVAVVR